MTSMNDDISGPRGYPVIGAMMEFRDASKFHIDLLRLSKKHGEVFSAYMGRK